MTDLIHWDDPHRWRTMTACGTFAWPDKIDSRAHLVTCQECQLRAIRFGALVTGHPGIGAVVAMVAAARHATEYVRSASLSRPDTSEGWADRQHRLYDLWFAARQSRGLESGAARKGHTP